MTFDSEQKLVAEVRQYVTENVKLSSFSDEQLQEEIEAIVAQRLAGVY